MELEQLRRIAKNIKLVVSDMDGTLLRDDKEISEGTLEACRLLRKKGIAVSVATGRVFNSIDYYVQKLGLETPAICANGAEIVDPKTRKPLVRHAMGYEESTEYIRFLKSIGVKDLSVMAAEGVVVEHGNIHDRRYAKQNADYEAAGCRPFERLYFGEGYNLAGYTPLKINFFPKDEEMLNKARAYADRTGVFTITTADALQYETMHRGVNKGTGLLELAEILGFSAGQCMAFGDFDNDLPMFRVAALPVAMENAEPEVKAAALYITAGNNEDGILRAVETLFFGAGE